MENNTDVSQILTEAEKYVANLDAILKEDTEMNHATEFLINEYKTNKRYFCTEGTKPTIDDVIKTCVEFAWASSRNYHNNKLKMNCLYIDYASLYGVKPGENDFSGAIDRSLEQGIKHVSENFLTELSELLTERRNERRNKRK